MSAMQRFNAKFETSAVGRFFHVAERKTTLGQEIRAGLVTFLAVAYILAVNSNIVADTGGTCTSNDCTGPLKGQFACRFTDPGFSACVDEVRKHLVTVTAVSSLIGTLIIGLLANLPLAIAPGLGLNAYFTYVVVGYYGTGKVSYQEALAAIFIEGWIFVILSLTGVRQWLIHLLPQTLVQAMSTGIGLFLAFIGLQAGEGIGVVTGDGATLVTLGGCAVDDRIPPYYIKNATFDSICAAGAPGFADAIGVPGTTYECNGGKMLWGPTWLGLAGLAVMVILMARGNRAAIIIGIVSATIIAWIPGHGASYLGHTSNIPGGIGGTGPARWQYFKKVVAVPRLGNLGAALDFGSFHRGDLWIALITFLYVDFFDATGTLFAMANYIDSFIPGFIDSNRNFPRSMMAYCSDGLSIVIGSVLGSTPCTVFIESATGIRSGGRTGLTALTISCCFFVALWFTPLIASIPVFATGPALILVGALMMVNVVKIDWTDVNKAVPAFITIVTMPLTYSIAYGVIGGVVAFIIAHAAKWVLDRLDAATGGRFIGPDEGTAAAALAQERKMEFAKPSQDPELERDAAATRRHHTMGDSAHGTVELGSKGSDFDDRSKV